jgi:tetratricopeptide (TPR) repeat protein
MKLSIVVLVLLGAVVVIGAILYSNHQKIPPPAPVAESAPVQTINETSSEKIIVPKQEQLITSKNTDNTAQTPLASPIAVETKSDPATNAVAKLVNALLTAKTAAEKHELFQQLLKSGQMDQAIAELKQRAADDPNNPQLPTTIGEALLNKVRAIHEAGGDINDQGILAMQADQSFNAALKIDPQNWEANFVKASSMYYWPAEVGRDNDVVQRLSGLIDRQETMPSQPEFVQTYLVLGNEYQKIGQQDKALATWQLGLAKFPSNPALQGKVNGQ